MPYTPTPAVVQATPSNPTATASATYVMMGLGVAGANAWALTPQITGRVLIMVSGDITQNTTADGATMQLSFGTGSAPANGAAVTGTQLGGQVTMTFLTGVLTVPFAMQALVTGLAIPSINAQGQTSAATPVWFDLALKAVTGGSASLSNLTVTAIEL